MKFFLKNHNPEIYHEHIDGLRAIAVLSVVINHLNRDILPGGYVGVDIFFVISGYLITGLLKKEIENNQFSFLLFYERRARRIFPALFSVIFISIFFSFCIFLPSDFLDNLKASLSTLFFVSNFYFWRELSFGYFNSVDSSIVPLLHTWSLAVEEQYYIFFPLFLFFVYKLKIKFISILLLIIFTVSLVASELFIKNHEVAVFFLSPFRMWELVLGSLLAYNFFPKLKSNFLRELIVLLGIVFIFLSIFFLDNLNYLFPGLMALFPVVGSILIIYAGNSGDSFFIKFFKLKILVYIGLISYSLYLWHWPIIVFGKYLIYPADPENSFLLIFFLLSLIISGMSYHFIEQPFRGKRGLSTFSRAFVFKGSSFVLVIFSIFIYLGINKNGFDQRFNDRIIQYDKQREPDKSYEECDYLSIEKSCIVGDKKYKSKIAIWGDSHLISLATAFNKSLVAQGKSAYLNIASNCPPFINLNKWTRNYNCPNFRNNFQKFIDNSNLIETVIIVGYWEAYFNKKNYVDLEIIDPATNLRKKVNASEPFENTLEWLLNEKKINVILIEQVPSYKKNPSFMLARSLLYKKEFPFINYEVHKNRNIKFYNLVDKFKSNKNFYFIDVANFMCKNKNCIVNDDKNSFYHDETHLNRFGSIFLSNYITKHLKNF